MESNNEEIEKIKLSEYCGYSENRGVIECKGCGGQIWVGYPEEGDEENCFDCGCKMIFVKG